MAVPASAVRTARAWLLDVGGGYRVAAGAHHVIEYLLAPETLAVPRPPVHCPGVLLWRERLIPVVDLAPLLPARGIEVAGWRHAVVLAWQDAPGEPLKHGALVVRAAPFEAFIADDMACALPPEVPVFGRIASSCFSHVERPVPVLDIARLFGRLPPDLVSGHGEETRDAPDVAAVVATQNPTPPSAPDRAAPASQVPGWFEVAAMSSGAGTPMARAEQDAPVVEAAGTGAPANSVSVSSAGETMSLPSVDESAAPMPGGAVGDAASREREVLPLLDAVGHVEPAPAAARGPQAGARPSAWAGQARSAFSGSRARLRMSERRPAPARWHMWLLWAGCAAAAAMALWMSGIWLGGANEPPSANRVPAASATQRKTLAVRDTAPARLDSTSTPTAPAQPPN